MFLFILLFSSLQVSLLECLEQLYKIKTFYFYRAMERLLTNDRFIAYKRAKKDYEDPPENTLNFAYENRRYPHLARELKDSDNILKKKILEEVNKDFWDHSNIVQALMTSDLVHVLIDHLVDPDNELRELSINSMV